MSQNTFPAFTNMLPYAEDIQLIVDSLRQEDRNRITRDGIFTPGIVNAESDYLQKGSGSDGNSLKIKPFIAYTANGNRIEIDETLDELYPQGSVIPVTDANRSERLKDVPVWDHYGLNYENISSSAALTEPIAFAKLGKGSVLHGIKLRINTLFGVTGATVQPNIYVSIGTVWEPDKFVPETLVSSSASIQDINVMNLMYSLSDTDETDIYITFKSDSVPLNTLTNGTLTIDLCVANLKQFSNTDDAETVDGGYRLRNDSGTGTWQASTTYHIVARYVEINDDLRSLSYKDGDGNIISTEPEYTRKITSYQLCALRKSGNYIDLTTADDVKLGEVIVDNNHNVVAININGTNPKTGNVYTEYLTIPGHRFIKNIDASQIADGSVDNQKFQYLNTLNENVQSQLNTKASVTEDNVFEGENTFNNQIKGSIDKVNGFSASATPTPNNLLVLDENGKVPATAISESTVASIGNLYTVSSGVVENGRSNFLIPNTTKTGVVIQATAENPLVINYPEGSVEKITSNQTVSGLAADGYYYLIKEKGGNFVFLPTSGGTRETVSIVNTLNKFNYDGQEGIVSSKYDNPTAYKAFDGTINSSTTLGYVTYINKDNVESTTYAPSTFTWIQVEFPEAITPTSISLCFRNNSLDATPRVWEFEGSNDGEEWTPIYQTTSQQPSTWNKGEIKNIPVSSTFAYKKWRISFELNDTTINNYIRGEETEAAGITMPINCYYFQIYATNTDTTKKGEVIEGYVKPSGMLAGSYFLDISKKPYTGYKANGNDEFIETPFTKLGFVNLTGYGTNNVILTCYPFCYNTFTKNNDVAAYDISKNAVITFEHNLGVIPNIVDVKFKCVSANENTDYSVGDIITDLYAGKEIVYNDTVLGLTCTSLKNSYSVDITSIKFRMGSANEELYVRNKLTGVLTPISAGDFRLIIYCSRGW